MAWNEPGGSGGKDPWGNRRNEQGPPDLDEILKKLQNRLSGFFGGGGGDGGGGGGRGGSLGVGLIAIILIAVWALSGIYIVDQGRRGVVTQFGDLIKVTAPGPHWYPRFVQRVEIVNVEQNRSVSIGATPDEGLMLTQDENIVDIQFTVQYRVKEPEDYLFNVRGPDTTLRQAAESAMREIVGKNRMDFVITVGRGEVGARTEKLTQEILDRYDAGLMVTELNLQQAQPPEQVQPAFLDAIKAREDEQRFKNNAEAYKNEILPKARGQAARMLEEAQGYRQQVESRAEGDTSRFLAIYGEYQKAPEVTRNRLYLETMQAVMEQSNKVMIDVKEGNNLVYLPLDKIMDQRRPVGATGSGDSSNGAAETLEERVASDRLRDRLRSREAP